MRLVCEGALVGIAVGLVISLYRFMLSHAEELMRFATAWLKDGGAIYLVWFAVLAVICVIVSVLMVREPYTQASGIPQIDAEVAGRIDMPWWRVLPIKFVEGVLCAAGGLSLGREGPSVMLGGMAGKGVSKLVHGERKHERLLVTCGAAAGMSAAFHAPLTGVLFAIEEIHREFSASLVISVMTASVFSDFVSSQLLGVTPLIHLVMYSSLPHELYPAVILMGVVCGVAGCVHNAGMFAVQDRLFGPYEHKMPVLRLAIPFALAGVAAYAWPDLMCGGDAIIERVMNLRSETMLSLLLLLVGKYMFTALCFGSSAPGGTLFPLVVMGMLVGALYGLGLTYAVGMPSFHVNSFVVLGIAGLFASVIQAPVTAVVMVFELTGSLEALLATSIVSVVAYVTATLLKTDAFYEHLLARMLGKKVEDGSASEALRGRMIIKNYVVGVGSRIEGATIRDVEWPKDALVVSIRQSGKKIVPKGDTPIVALSEVSVLMDEADERSYDVIMQHLVSPRD